MAPLWRLTATPDLRADRVVKDSAFLCDRFWEAVHLDFGDFDDDMSICCNDDYAFFGGRSLSAFNQICSIPRTGGTRSSIHEGSSTTHDSSGWGSLPSPSSASDERGRTLVRATSAGKAFGSTANTGRLHDAAFNRDRSSPPIRRNLSQPTRRRSTPAINLMTMASSFFDTVLRLTQSPPHSPNATVSSSKESSVTIIESDVLVNIIEEAQRAGLWDAGNLLELQPKEELQGSPVYALEALLGNGDSPSPRLNDWNWPHWADERADNYTTAIEVDV